MLHQMTGPEKWVALIHKDLPDDVASPVRVTYVHRKRIVSFDTDWDGEDAYRVTSVRLEDGRDVEVGDLEASLHQILTEA